MDYEDVQRWKESLRPKAIIIPLSFLAWFFFSVSFGIKFFNSYSLVTSDGSNSGNGGEEESRKTKNSFFSKKQADDSKSQPLV
mmetsp:Transcript_21976/g.27188  ORF Transcript_21976/g.27188 Transcript_21976/m.27188 type:complete len:83 (-) Transcript_21976:102-350(-)